MLTLTVALVVLSPACAAPSPAAPTASGVQGLVLRGPIAPVCRQGVPCDGPALVTLVFSRNGKEAARVRTGKDGRFRLALAPALYTVRTTERVFGRIPQPERVTVRKAHWTRITFRIDTGIR